MRFNHVLRQTERIVVVAAACLALGSCATTQPQHRWTEQALNAETAQFEGDLDHAEARYRALLPDAPDEDRRRWLLHNLGLIAAERGDRQEAIDRFEVVWREDIGDLHGANSLYEVAKLHQGDAAVEYRLKVARRYPNQVSADFAVQDIVGTFEREHRFRELEQLIVDLIGSVEDSELADNLWLQLGLLRREHLSDPDGALDAYRTLYLRHGEGPLGDDALWEMANIYRAHQYWEPAIELLALLSSNVESSWFLGDYNSAWLDDAMYEAGFIELVYRDDLDAAERWFKRYLKTFPEGILSDDAAWHLVEIERLRGNDADYLQQLRAFAEDYPQSRHVRVVNDRLGGAS